MTEFFRQLTTTKYQLISVQECLYNIQDDLFGYLIIFYILSRICIQLDGEIKENIQACRLLNIAF